ncbi:MAG: hypothetical protein NZ874_03740 [Fimbriimonadales bacterium]|nr:hypothetical protein [Fimbriimonadales bacterium]
MAARRFLRYGLSLIMIVLGVTLIYYEYFLYRQWLALPVGGLLIVWAFVRIWLLRRMEQRYLR